MTRGEEMSSDLSLAKDDIGNFDKKKTFELYMNMK